MMPDHMQDQEVPMGVPVEYLLPSQMIPSRIHQEAKESIANMLENSHKNGFLMYDKFAKTVPQMPPWLKRADTPPPTDSRFSQWMGKTSDARKNVFVVGNGKTGVIYSRRSGQKLVLPPGTYTVTPEDSTLTTLEHYPWTIFNIENKYTNMLMLLTAAPDIPSTTTAMYLADGSIAKLIPRSHECGAPFSIPPSKTLHGVDNDGAGDMWRADVIETKNLKPKEIVETSENEGLIEASGCYVIFTNDCIDADENTSIPMGKRYVKINQPFALLAKIQKIATAIDIVFPWGTLTANIEVDAHLCQERLEDGPANLLRTDDQLGVFKSIKQPRIDKLTGFTESTSYSANPLLHEDNIRHLADCLREKTAGQGCSTLAQVPHPSRHGAEPASQHQDAYYAKARAILELKQREIILELIHKSTSPTEAWMKTRLIRGTKIGGTQQFENSRGKPVDIGDGQYQPIKDKVSDELQRLIKDGFLNQEILDGTERITLSRAGANGSDADEAAERRYDQLQEAMRHIKDKPALNALQSKAQDALKDYLDARLSEYCSRSPFNEFKLTTKFSTLQPSREMTAQLAEWSAIKQQKDQLCQKQAQHAVSLETQEQTALHKQERDKLARNASLAVFQAKVTQDDHEAMMAAEALKAAHQRKIAAKLAAVHADTELMSRLTEAYEEREPVAAKLKGALDCDSLEDIFDEKKSKRVRNRALDELRYKNSTAELKGDGDVVAAQKKATVCGHNSSVLEAERAHQLLMAQAKAKEQQTQSPVTVDAACIQGLFSACNGAKRVTGSTAETQPLLQTPPEAAMERP